MTHSKTLLIIDIRMKLLNLVSFMQYNLQL